MSVSRSFEASKVLERPIPGPAKAKGTPMPRRHLLDLDDFSKEDIEEVLETAAAMKDVLRRDIKKVPTLRGRMMVTLFYETSTRTRISFEEAGKVLSAEVINMDASRSSVEKGESLLNTALTLQAMGTDMLVIRHPHSGAAYFVARHLDSISVINAGDGWHAHPSQALLDLYTIKERLGQIEGLKVVIVGDVLHSRVARSNLWGLTIMGAQVTLCGPPTLLPNYWPNSGDGHSSSHTLASVQTEANLDRAIEGADVVMALRLQLERQNAGFFPSLREYTRLWQVNEARLEQASSQVVVTHPGPMNEGIELSPQVAHGVRSLIQEQVTNGVAVRMALLYLLSAGTHKGGNVEF